MTLIYDPASGIYQYTAAGNVKSQPLKFVADIAERNTLNTTYKIVWVIDASADESVESGGAFYGRKDNGTWEKISEKESMDLMFTWDNIPGKPNSTPAEIDAAVAATANIYVPAEPVLITILEADNDAGYVTLVSSPRTAKKITVAQAGIILSNKQLFGDGADYDILNDNQLHINNNGGATNLSGRVSTNDKIVVTYLA